MNKDYGEMCSIALSKFLNGNEEKKRKIEFKITLQTKFYYNLLGSVTLGLAWL